MQFLAQHVQGCMAAQGHLCHLPVSQEEGNCVAGTVQPDDEQRAITHVVFTRAVCLLVFRLLTFVLQLWDQKTITDVGVEGLAV